MFSVLTSAIESVAGIDSKTAFTFCERCASFDDLPHLVHLCVLEALISCLFLLYFNPLDVTEMSKEFSV